MKDKIIGISSAILIFASIKLFGLIGLLIALGVVGLIYRKKDDKQ